MLSEMRVLVRTFPVYKEMDAWARTSNMCCFCEVYVVKPESKLYSFSYILLEQQEKR